MIQQPTLHHTTSQEVAARSRLPFPRHRRSNHTEATIRNEKGTKGPLGLKVAAEDSRGWTATLKSSVLGESASILVLRDTESRRQSRRKHGQHSVQEDNATLEEIFPTRHSTTQILDMIKKQATTPGQDEVNSSIESLRPSDIPAYADRLTITRERFNAIVGKLLQQFNQSQLSRYVSIQHGQRLAKLQTQEDARRAFKEAEGSSETSTEHVAQEDRPLSRLKQSQWLAREIITIRKPQRLLGKRAIADALLRSVWQIDVAEETLCEGKLTIYPQLPLIQILNQQRPGRTSTLSDISSRHQVRIETSRDTIDIYGSKPGCMKAVHDINLSANSAASRTFDLMPFAKDARCSHLLGDKEKLERIASQFGAILNITASISKVVPCLLSPPRIANQRQQCVITAANVSQARQCKKMLLHHLLGTTESPPAVIGFSVEEGIARESRSSSPMKLARGDVPVLMRPEQPVIGRNELENALGYLHLDKQYFATEVDPLGAQDRHSTWVAESELFNSVEIGQILANVAVERGTSFETYAPGISQFFHSSFPDQKPVSTTYLTTEFVASPWHLPSLSSAIRCPRLKIRLTPDASRHIFKLDSLLAQSPILRKVLLSVPRTAADLKLVQSEYLSISEPLRISSIAEAFKNLNDSAQLRGLDKTQWQSDLIIPIPLSLLPVDVIRDLSEPPNDGTLEVHYKPLPTILTERLSVDYDGFNLQYKTTQGDGGREVQAFSQPVSYCRIPRYTGEDVGISQRGKGRELERSSIVMPENTKKSASITEPAPELKRWHIDELPQSFYYVPDFITHDEEESLISQRWVQLSHRRLQVYPAQLSSKNVLLADKPLPLWLSAPLVGKFADLGLFAGTAHEEMNHVLINEYQPGQGIMPHEDGDAYAPVTVTVSLGGTTVLNLYEKGEQKPQWRVLQEERSLLVTCGDAYSGGLLHGIEETAIDKNLSRETICNWLLLSDPERFESGQGIRMGGWVFRNQVEKEAPLHEARQQAGAALRHAPLLLLLGALRYNAAMTAPALTQRQLHSLLDILSHLEIYAEIQDFRHPGTLESYGPPFTADAKHSTSPSLQTLFSKFILSLPGLREVSPTFWKERASFIVGALENAELSDSYDKGAIGIRKTLATAISSLIEYPARGVQAGFDPPIQGKGKDETFDLTSADDLERSFREIAKLVVYGDMLEELFKTVERTDKLSDHTNIVQAVHEFILVNLASFMHYTLILSPKGQGLLTLAEHTNRMIPYTIIKSTLKIGNVATMISSMLRVVLAKVSLSTVTNWVGWTKDADEGMNLLQSIMSGVLNWENRDLKSRASKIEKNKDAPSREQLAELKKYSAMSREEHQSIRDYSLMESKSIAFAILSASPTSTDLNEAQHALALEYLSLTLAIRDREQIVHVLCHSSPDHLTHAIRDVVSAYDPIIRNLHRAVDLSDTIYDCERFISDTIKLAKIPDPSSRRSGQPVPTVGDFVQLLKKHQYSLHKFLHQCAKNGKELTSWFYDWADKAVKQFRRADSESKGAPDGGKGAGDLEQPLLELFATLPMDKQKYLIPTLDAHADHLATLHASSMARLNAVLSSPSSFHPALAGSKPASSNATPVASRPSSRSRGTTGANNVDPGPGSFLAKWQDLLDRAPITPSVSEGGKVRNGGAGDVMSQSEKVINEDEKSPPPPGDNSDDESDDIQFEDAHEKLEAFGVDAKQRAKEASDVGAVFEALGPSYRKMLGDRNG
ncbi:hypothetical protein FH972_022850 [Carpinus fangiana]|uniref:Fe2OG dioxygenase domain-containing protein n=1 Tax=Carpinus fangiana TaxID=176857 RepID=A0A5N6KTR9_9ROSI|nr:hypothetical protein FH972_022850 [Carpinus fangiana]